MTSLFSHPNPDETTKSQQASQVRPRKEIYADTNFSLAELWQAFSEYLHLWWPVSLRSSYEAHVELSDQLLIEETADGELQPLAQILHLVPGDIVALLPLEDALGSSFTEGVSFTFDEAEDGEGSSLEISSGILKPRDVGGDEELGVYMEDVETARMLLDVFTKFIGIKRP